MRHSSKSPLNSLIVPSRSSADHSIAIDLPVEISGGGSSRRYRPNLFHIHTDYSRGPGNLPGDGALLLGPAEIALVLLDHASQKLGCLAVDLLSAMSARSLWKHKVDVGQFTPINAADERAIEPLTKNLISSIRILRRTGYANVQSPYALNSLSQLSRLTP